ncbi:MAG TPA: MarR family transcriptional regulator [Solirubrobacteraceae bacterium]|nr:MarR family transcriptional regulator [Solirubrobacteraceae bacterium]
MTATRRTGTLVLIARLSKQSQRATPEAAMGMSLRHYMALWAIPGSISQAQLADHLCIDANNTVILLNELESEGWITRERDPADRRRHLVSITDAGRAQLQHAIEAREAVSGEVLAKLSDEERGTLHELLAKALGEEA